jgi:hypothetical protein
MSLTAEQHSQIASVYEKAAADETLPSPFRTAFINKAKWYRMLRQIEEARLSAGIVLAIAETAPKRRYLSLAEKLSRARAARGTVEIKTENFSGDEPRKRMVFHIEEMTNSMVEGRKLGRRNEFFSNSTE